MGWWYDGYQRLEIAVSVPIPRSNEHSQHVVLYLPPVRRVNHGRRSISCANCDLDIDKHYHRNELNKAVVTGRASQDWLIREGSRGQAYQEEMLAHNRTSNEVSLALSQYISLAYT